VSVSIPVEGGQEWPRSCAEQDIMRLSPPFAAGLPPHPTGSTNMSVVS